MDSFLVAELRPSAWNIGRLTHMERGTKHAEVGSEFGCVIDLFSEYRILALTV